MAVDPLVVTHDVTRTGEEGTSEPLRCRYPSRMTDDDTPRLRPSQQLAALLGFPEPEFTDEELRVYREKMRKADEELEAIIARRQRRTA